MPAEGPSLGTPPAGTWMWISRSLKKSLRSPSDSAWARANDSAAWADSFITSPSWPVSISWPRPAMICASTCSTSPPCGVQARPLASPISSSVALLVGDVAGRAQVLGQIGRPDADPGRLAPLAAPAPGCSLALHHLAGHLARHLRHHPLQLAQPGLAGVLDDHLAQHRPGHVQVLHGQPGLARSAWGSGTARRWPASLLRCSRPAAASPCGRAAAPGCPRSCWRWR